MKHTLNMMAFDLGASNGRAILGRFDGEKIVMEELHRYENDYVRLGGKLYWDCLNLYQQMKQGFHAFRRADAGELASFGVDTWGVDYGLLDRNGCLLGNPRSYRMSEDADMERVYQTVPFETLFALSGIGAMNFNTLFQLCRRRAEGDVALEQAETMLLMPDLLGYFFTGEKKSEYTIASTTMLYNPSRGDWDWETIDALGLPRRCCPIWPRSWESTGLHTRQWAAMTRPRRWRRCPVPAALPSAPAVPGPCLAWRPTSRS